jgi:cytochrome c5
MNQTLLAVAVTLGLISSGAAFAQDGAAVYTKYCAGCHNSMKNDTKAKSTDAMVKITVDGKGPMRPRGGANLSDADVRAAVVHMQGLAK